MKRNHKIVRNLGWIVFTGAVILVTGCRNYRRDHHLDSTSFDRKWLDKVQHDSGITLPDGSCGLNMFYQGSSFDPIFVAKIQIPSSGHETLAKQLDQLPDAHAEVMNSLTDKVSWWTPLQGNVEMEKTYHHDEAGVRVLLVQEAGRLLLYIEWIHL